MTEFSGFETERLILRGVTEKDIPLWRQHLTDDEIVGHLIPGGVFLNPEAVLSIQGNGQWVWGIFLKSQPDVLIGMIFLRREGVNRGFWLGKEHWGRGIMTEALAPVMKYAFNTLNFDRMILGNAFGNTRSRRLKEKDGAVFIKTEPAHYVNPEYKEREVWELTKERWERFNTTIRQEAP